MRTDQDIHKRAKNAILDEMRELWREAKQAKLQADTAKSQAVMVMRQVEEFADRIRYGQLDPYEVLAILNPLHPDVEEWIALVNARAAEGSATEEFQKAS